MISSDISSMRHAEAQCGAHPGMTPSGPSGREVGLAYIDLGGPGVKFLEAPFIFPELLYGQA